ncbi:MAG: hypothetical protein ACO23N_04930 [Opitutales bacterium]|jgi:hypothetical protein
MAKPNPLLLALGIPLAVMAFVGVIILGRSGGKFGSLTPFPADTYRKDWATLQGNAYVFACQVDKQLAFVEGSGRILSVKPIDTARGAGSIPVRVPASISDNFESGQRYNLKIRVRKDVLEVEEIENF